MTLGKQDGVQDILVKYSNAQQDEAVRKADAERLRIEREEQAKFEGEDNHPYDVALYAPFKSLRRSSNSGEV